MMRIGAFSRLGRVSIKALRHYEAIGLLRPARIDAATGYRHYDESQLDALHRLMVLRALGLPLKCIRDALRQPPSPEQMRRLLDERKASLARKIDAERVQLAAIEARIRHLEGAAGEAAYNVVVRDVPPVFVAGLRRVVAADDAVEALFDEIAGILPRTARLIGRGAVWHRCAPQKGEIDVEALMLLEGPGPAPRGVEIYQLPGCRAACVVHPSDESAFAPAYAAVRKAMTCQRYALEGPMRERYFSSAEDSRFDLTEIQFPLRPTQGVAA